MLSSYFSSPKTAPQKPPRQPADTSAPKDISYIDSSRRIARISNQYRILKKIPHDSQFFTQGLTVLSLNEKGNHTLLVEGTGLYGDSQIVIYDPNQIDETTSLPKLLTQIPLDAHYFGEGICLYEDSEGVTKVIQLTYKEQLGLVYRLDRSTLKLVPESVFPFTTTTSEGWGITYDPKQQEFYVSDGSEWIQVWNLARQEIRRFRVTFVPSTEHIQQPQRIANVNELEWDASTSTILANVWYQDVLVRIDPMQGYVLTVYDLSNLYINRDPNADCLNGIAIDPQYPYHVWVTGKNWPHLYFLELAE